MRVRMLRWVILCLPCLVFPGMAQNPSPQSKASPSKRDGSAPASTLQIFSRVVTLEVVATDRKGQHVTGLKPSDFEVLEQDPKQGNKKRQQKIAGFREVRISDLTSSSEIRIPIGIYTNVVELRKNSVPPTILLMDGLNTPVQYQAQVHLEMLKTLQKLPRNLPIAVYLFGNGLHMVQDFTTNPVLLQTALKKAISTAGVGLATVDPRDNKDSLANQMADLLGDGQLGPTSTPTRAPALTSPNTGPTATTGTADVVQRLIETAAEFEQRSYAADMTMRVNRTADALIALARHVAGYPGRKNLLWVSSGFPIALSPVGSAGSNVIDEEAGFRDYSQQLQRVSTALNNAKIAVYPIDPAGVQVPAVYGAGAMPRDVSGPGMGQTIDRDTNNMFNAQETMRVLAKSTGGKVCTQNYVNDCVRRAIEDSSDYYEIAYYPSSRDWDGQYRRIVLKPRRHGLHLVYRRGYYATPLGGVKPDVQSAEMQTACRDSLNATGIFFAARNLPSNPPAKLKFDLTINASALSFLPTSDGGYELKAEIGVCTYNKKGWPLRYMSYPENRKLDVAQYNALMAAGGLSEIIYVPGPKPAAVRLEVEDVPSGRLGSVHINILNGGTH